MRGQNLAHLTPHLLLAAESSSVRLFVNDKPIALRESVRRPVEQKVVVLVQSSNFHSSPSDKFQIFTAAEVQQNYRDVIAGSEYLLMLFSPAKKITTVEGEITVADIVISMRGPSGKNTVFTIDEAGTVVSHAKYGAVTYLELMKAVTAARE